ncbi:MAG: STAS domain-containing protein, partial [Cyanobacteria bacterium]|nr:STAS domain-containing protein [Cyanobacteriota bacterium]
MISKSEKNDILTLKADQDFTILNALELQKKLIKLLEKKTSGAVVLDLSRIELMDSIGVKIIIGLFTTCQEKNLSLSIEVASEQILR